MAAFDAKRSIAELKRRLFQSPAVDLAETERSQGTLYAPLYTLHIIVVYDSHGLIKGHKDN